MVFEFDDFGCDYLISDMCQSHDCRDALSLLKDANPAFKVTLFSIPGQMTQALLDWAEVNKDWVELAVHGFYHASNYECHQMTYLEFEEHMAKFEDMIDRHFVRVFRAPGWQISDDALHYLADNGWVIADQGYNDGRRPEMKAYVNYDGVFKVDSEVVPAWHGHTWNCVGNGIYETIDHLQQLVAETKEFKTVSELFT